MKGFQFVNKYIECELSQMKMLSHLKLQSSVILALLLMISTLSSIYVDYDNNNDFFVMDDVRFWNEIISTRKNDNDTKVVYDKNEKISYIKWDFPVNKIKSNPVFIVSDIFGNDIVVKPIRRKV